MAPVLSIQGLGVRRNDELILRDVDWEIRSGENWAILGANGSGKTSLLSALTGYLTPSEGEIALLGQRFGQSDWRELRKKVGMVSSSVRQLMPDIEPAWDTVVSGKYAMIDLWEKPSREDRDKALRLLRQIGCLHLKDRRWGVLSQGERQRVLIARALMAQPKLLILDEPCAGLDPVAREHFLLFLDRLNEKKNAPVLVLVTHHVEEITAAFTHALVLRRGSVLASGRKQAVLNSDVLSKAFDSPVKLLKSKNRLRVEVEPSKKIF